MKCKSIPLFNPKEELFIMKCEINVEVVYVHLLCCLVLSIVTKCLIEDHSESTYVHMATHYPHVAWIRDSVSQHGDSYHHSPPPFSHTHKINK